MLNALRRPISPLRGRWAPPLSIAAVAVVAIVLGAWYQNGWAPKRWGVVEPGLIYRSGQITSRRVRDVLAQNQIRVVVDLTGDDPTNPDQPAERAAIASLGIEVAKCPLLGDGTGDIESYASAIAKIASARKARQPVLVHCSAGAQRTGGVVAAYRILVEKKSPRQAWVELQQFGWSPRKDRVLVDYLNAHFEELARRLVDRGVIAAAPQPVPKLEP